VAGERGVSHRLRLVEGERREAGRVPDALIRRVRSAMIEVEGLSKSFGATRALAGVDMSIPRGTVQGLFGPNGRVPSSRSLFVLLFPLRLRRRHPRSRDQLRRLSDPGHHRASGRLWRHPPPRSA
jgi:hypothetical protein